MHARRLEPALGPPTEHLEAAVPAHDEVVQAVAVEVPERQVERGEGDGHGPAVDEAAQAVPAQEPRLRRRRARHDEVAPRIGVEASRHERARERATPAGKVCGGSTELTGPWSRIDTVSAGPFVTARSGLPSASNHPAATPAGPGPAGNGPPTSYPPRPFARKQRHVVRALVRRHEIAVAVLVPVHLHRRLRRPPQHVRRRGIRGLERARQPAGGGVSTVPAARGEAAGDDERDDRASVHGGPRGGRRAAAEDAGDVPGGGGGRTAESSRAGPYVLRGAVSACVLSRRAEGASRTGDPPATRAAGSAATARAARPASVAPRSPRGPSSPAPAGGSARAGGAPPARGRSPTAGPCDWPKKSCTRASIHGRTPHRVLDARGPAAGQRDALGRDGVEGAARARGQPREERVERVGLAQLAERGAPLAQATRSRRRGRPRRARARPPRAPPARRTPRARAAGRAPPRRRRRGGPRAAPPPRAAGTPPAPSPPRWRVSSSTRRSHSRRREASTRSPAASHRTSVSSRRPSGSTSRSASASIALATRTNRPPRGRSSASTATSSSASETTLSAPSVAEPPPQSRTSGSPGRRRRATRSGKPASTATARAASGSGGRGGRGETRCVAIGTRRDAVRSTARAAHASIPRERSRSGSKRAATASS